MQTINRKVIEALAAPFQFNPDTIEAVIRKEAGRGGFDPQTGKIVIQFEPHKFKAHVKEYLKKEFLAINAKVERKEPLTGAEKVIFERWVNALKNKVELQAAEWSAFIAALAIDQTAALLSTSWGAFQILGENHFAAGYRNVIEMHQDYLTGELAQLKSFLKFCHTNRTLRSVLMNNDLKLGDCGIFARFYNGAGFINKPVAERYDTLLFKHYQNIKAGR